MLQEKNCWPGNLYPLKIHFNNESELKVFFQISEGWKNSLSAYLCNKKRDRKIFTYKENDIRWKFRSTENKTEERIINGKNKGICKNIFLNFNILKDNWLRQEWANIFYKNPDSILGFADHIGFLLHNLPSGCCCLHNPLQI